MRLLFAEYYILLPYFLSLNYLWFIYFKINYYSVGRRLIASDKLQKRNTMRAINSKLLSYVIIVYLIFFIFNYFALKGNSTTIWWQHLIINNLYINLLNIVYLVNIITLLVVYNYSYLQRKINYNFFFSIGNLSIFLAIIFLSNTFFTLFFTLEITTLVLFYKLTVSKFSISNHNTISKKQHNKPTSIIYKSFSNMLFFSYWTTFFSSILFVYIITMLVYYFGTTEWIVVNHILKTSVILNYANTNVVLFFLSIFMSVAFFLKTGLTPFHFYKIELYKGLPFVSIFFYNTFFFFFYFMVFVTLILYNIYVFYSLFSIYTSCLIVISAFYIISLLFNLNYLKAFFAYSTIINSLMFLILIFAAVY